MLQSSIIALAAVAGALAAPFPSARVPLMGWSEPKAFLGLDDGFSTPIGTVAFLPGLHSCGTLSIFAVEPELDFEDFALLPRQNGTDGEVGVWERYENARTKVAEGDAVEGTILAWARGWRSTCGKGAANKEVRVQKVLVDGADPREDRAGWVASLDEHLRPLLAALPTENGHNNVVLLTSLSPATLMSLFDVASPPPSSPPTSDDKNPNLPPGYPARRRRQHGLLWRLISLLFSLAFWAALGFASAFAADRALAYWRARKEQQEGAVALPINLSREQERELEFDLGSEDGEGADELPLAHAMRLPETERAATEAAGRR
ncbi:hypothetical protein JCM10213_008142 [Rhodosporidiobolus nylandii]